VVAVFRAKVFGDQTITIAYKSNGEFVLYAGQNEIGQISRLILDTDSHPGIQIHFKSGLPSEKEMQIESFIRALYGFPVQIIRD